MTSTLAMTAGLSEQQERESKLKKVGDSIETIKDSVRVIEIVTSQHGERKTITELYMLGDRLRES